jgi:SAM-dependent methyltransferase
LECTEVKIPLSGEKWAAKSEAYAALIAEHLTPQTVWLDAGCGSRLLESDMDAAEDWLAGRCRVLVGMDYAVTGHRNIRSLVGGSLYELPFADGSVDLVTCNMVVEHLDNPARAFAEVARCLSSTGAFVVKTPNVWNYGVMANAAAARILPEGLRLRLAQGSDGRRDHEFFPVRYRANTMSTLTQRLERAGLQVHKAVALAQQRAFFRKTGSVEKLLMKLTPVNGLLVCAHKRTASH